jgi:hypothetical protein
MPSAIPHGDEQSKQALVHGLLSEQCLDDTEPRRSASLREVATQFCWMGWIALPDVYIGLFQSVSFIRCAMNAMHACGYISGSEENASSPHS